MFLQVENVEQVDFLNTWLGGPKNQKAKATSNFPYLCPEQISLFPISAKEQINVWNMSQESMSLESP